MNWLERLPGPKQIGFEASTGYGSFYESFVKVADRVVVAHPGHLRLIFRCKRKNDRVDAGKLAKLLCLDEVPAVHVPKAEIRAWRELITFRRRLIEKRTRAKNAIRALLRTVRVTAPKRPGLWTRAGMAWLSMLVLEQGMHALKRDLLVDEIEQLTAQIKRVEAELARFSKGHPAVALLQTIPGVGLRTAEAVVAFMDNPHRFANSKAVGAYFGLVPSQDQSGPVNRLGHITKDGPATVRHLLTEAVWQAVRRSPTVGAFYERIHGGDKDRRKIAIVATAHYLARVMWSMWKHNRVWEESVTTESTTP
jgi:transposase